MEDIATHTDTAQQQQQHHADIAPMDTADTTPSSGVAQRMAAKPAEPARMEDTRPAASTPTSAKRKHVDMDEEDAAATRTNEPPIKRSKLAHGDADLASAKIATEAIDGLRKMLMERTSQNRADDMATELATMKRAAQNDHAKQLEETRTDLDTIERSIMGVLADMRKVDASSAAMAEKYSATIMRSLKDDVERIAFDPFNGHVARARCATICKHARDALTELTANLRAHERDHAAAGATQRSAGPAYDTANDRVQRSASASAGQQHAEEREAEEGQSPDEDVDATLETIFRSAGFAAVEDAIKKAPAVPPEGPASLSAGTRARSGAPRSFRAGTGPTVVDFPFAYNEATRTWSSHNVGGIRQRYAQSGNTLSTFVEDPEVFRQMLDSVTTGMVEAFDFSMETTSCGMIRV